MNKRIIVPVVTAAIVGAAAFGVSRVSAQVTEYKASSIVERIATRFNLDQDEVKAVFEEERADREAEMLQRLEERLNEAVTAGELTEEQKQLILDKHAEIRAEMEERWETIGSMTHEERQALIEDKRQEMQQRHEELEAWAEEHNIDLKYLMVRATFHGGPGMRGMKMMRFDTDSAAEDVVVEATTL